MVQKLVLTLVMFLFTAAAVHAQPYCNSVWGGVGFACDIACESSVCSYDPYCCNTNWDLLCATEAASDPNCQSCISPVLFCNTRWGGAGFPFDLACQNSVCSYDPYCCNTNWDSICANEAASDSNCQSCLSPPPVANCNSITVITACSFYTWSVTGITYYDSGIYNAGSNTLDLTIALGTQTSLAGSTNVCVGGTIGLTATGGNTYQWSGPNGYTNTGASITRNGATTAMSGTYTVTITHNECSVVRSINVMVHPTPSATISGATSVCNGGTISLSAPAGAVSYAWSGPGGFTSSTQNMTRSNATTAMAGTYKVTVTGAGGCTATASRSVTVAAPTAATITGATGFCSNGTITLTATTAGVSYQWSGPGGFSFSGATMTRTPAVAGTYTVTVQNAAGCISTASRTVSVTAAPTVSIQNNSNCNRVWLIASGGNSYQWSGPGFTGTGATVLRNPASYGMYGTYTVTVTGSGGCTTSASVTVNPCGDNGGSTKNGGIQLQQLLQAFPNPAQNMSTLSFTAAAQEPAILTVFNTEGKLIATLFNGTTEAGLTYQLPFDTALLPNGIYFAVLQYANGATENTRIMVVR
ncbi:MAG TPA: T9SS type A sorting domain-containing protein [Chitinophagales bacterium]|nr:T9SS type A sorting domain-containing protein [Chitinophagales bacterium]HRK27008.1 T9SS type A sorting domain-containing protein [Chitinophagales bacterium]